MVCKLSSGSCTNRSSNAPHVWWAEAAFCAHLREEIERVFAEDDEPAA